MPSAPQTAALSQAMQLALQHHQQGRLEQAESLYRQVTQADPANADAWHLLGVAAAQRGDHEAAVSLISRAISRRPEAALFHNNLGNALKALARADEAAASYRRAIERQPDFAMAYNNLAKVLREQYRYDEAQQYIQRALALQPDYAEAYNHLGLIAFEQEQIDQAVVSYRQALALQPDYAEARNNLGAAYAVQGQIDEAIACYRQALTQAPAYAAAHLNLAQALLLQGNFSQGWREYEWRWQGSAALEKDQRHFTQPQWRGESLAGRTLLLHTEQGLGDTLQFIRYAPLAARRGGRMIVECQPPLERLLRSLPEIAQVVPRGAPLPSFDVHCPLLSLPLIFDTTLDTIPATAPYLQAEAGLSAGWRQRIGASRRMNVGLVWAGSPRAHDPVSHLIDRRRSLSLAQFAPLAAVPGVHFYSLQKGTAAQQAAAPPAGMELTDFTADLHDFSDTAALVSQLDLVISVDTSVVHLAGAMGKPVWLLSRFDGCWRWLQERADSPWYPRLRIFRQPAPRAWAPVLADAAEALHRLASTSSLSPNR
ncbi:MAG TPA: sulfotransferase [Betaproteobacteria bacterium]|nr:sulfotransferase [Betaproteobacteria bacterium]